MALIDKIKCNGIKPSKAEVYTLAAELVELENLVGFHKAVVHALKSYDYYANDYEYDYEYDNYYDYDYYYYDYAYAYDYYNLSQKEKVIALLLLAAIYSTQT